MSQPFQPDPEKLSAFLEARKVADDILRLMVCDELQARLPDIEQKISGCAAHLRDSVEALKPSQEALDSLESDITEAQKEAAGWQAQAQAEGSIGKRAAARVGLAAVQEELDRLGEKRDQLVNEQQPLRRTRDEAKAALRDAQDELRQTEFNASDKNYALMGYGPSTTAFANWWLFGMFVPVLLSGDDSHFLWSQAMKAMEFVCLRSGFRTEGRDLPKESETYRRYWNEIYSNANPPEPAPTGREVIDADKAFVSAGIKARIEQARLDRDVFEDHRTPVPKPVRDYMRVPGR